jgi:hypothetical protein
MIILGVITLQRRWFYRASMLIGTAALFCTLAWLLQDAALATEFIWIEVIVTVILLLTATRLCKKSPINRGQIPF